MTRYGIGLLLLLFQGQSPADPIYETILARLREQHPSKQVVLRSAVANARCVEDCGGPLDLRAHDPEWLDRVQADGLVAGVCDERPDRPCARRVSKAGTDPENEIEVKLSEVRWIAGSVGEAFATHSVWGQRCRLCAYTIRYTVARVEGNRWRVASADTVDVAWLR